LLHCGLTLDGDWLQDAAHSLAAIAVALARQGDMEVVSDLLLRLEQAPQDGDRTAAAIALEELAARHLIHEPSDFLIARVMPLLNDAARSPYQRALLLITLGESLLPQGELPPALQRLAIAWAQEEDGWLGWMALQTLALFDILPRQRALLESRLRLHDMGTQWDLQPPAPDARPGYNIQGDTWYCSVLTALYRRDAYRFSPAVASYLRRPSFHVINPLLSALEELHSPKQATTLDSNAGQGLQISDAPRQEPMPLAKDIEEALIDRLRVGPQGPFASFDIEVCATLAHLTPDRFATEPWNEYLINWPADERAEFASALSEARCTTTSARDAAIIHLLTLVGDGQYVVRRAAYRALQAQAPQVFLHVCAALAIAPEVELRRRAAEACAWLPSQKAWQRRKAQDIYKTLRCDVDRSVRDDALRSRSERREREWSKYALDRILQPGDWNNQTILQRWKYGHVITCAGSDTELQTLRWFLRQTALPPHARRWLAGLLESGEKQWKTTAEKWPKPWAIWDGAFTAERATLTGADLSEPIPIHVILWSAPNDDTQKRQGVVWTTKAEIHLPTVGHAYSLWRVDQAQPLRIRLQSFEFIEDVYTAVELDQ
ncbi:MAG: hypothetical protein ACRDID_10300, partial [Ktedonobacterales bacterium]